MGEVVTERWNLRKDFGSLEPVAVDLQGQKEQVEVRKACVELG